MILLKNFRIRSGNIEADIYPEGSSVAGLLVVNSKGEIVEHLLPKGYEYCENHIAHAKRFIGNNYEKIINGKITEKIIMWY